MVTIINPATGETKLVEDPTLRLAIGWQLVDDQPDTPIEEPLPEPPSKPRKRG